MVHFRLDLVFEHGVLKFPAVFKSCLAFNLAKLPHMVVPITSKKKLQQ